MTIESPLSRRDFLLGVVVAGALGRRSKSSAFPSVEAVPTVFFANPDARNALVRFVVRDSEAVAGRLRVFDQARRPVGTAGVLGVGGRLYGELWLPLERETTYYTDLELPGQRGVIKSTHRLKPKRRWTIYWVTLPEPANLAGAEYLDHSAFLASGAVDERGLGTAVLEPVGTALSSVPLMLAGLGVRWVVRRDASQGAPVAFRGRDGSSVMILPVAPGGTPDDLGFSTGGEELSRRLERWIESAAALQAPDQARSALLVAGIGPVGATSGSAQVTEWSSRFAYPRIVLDKLVDFTAPLPASAPPMTPPPADAGVATPPRKDTAAARETERRARIDRLLAPLLARLGGGAGLAAVAAQFAFRAPTTLVFNPTPFSRSDVADLPDGTQRIVTDVPGTGYACVPSVPPAPWLRGGPELVLRNSGFTIRIDPASGAIRSVRGADEREWVRSDGPGWNALEGFRLGAAVPSRNALVGQRLVLARTGPNRVSLTTTVTLYDGLPWIDIRNELASGESPPCVFPFALEQPGVSWEIPGGAEIAAAPVAKLVHLRWVRLGSADDVVFFRGLDAPEAAVEQNGVLTSFPPPGVSRYRVGLASRFTLPEDAWQFGWGTEPFVTAAVPGTGRAGLSSYGSMILIDQSGIAVIDLRTARDGNGVIVFLQELLGTTRDVTLGPGLLSFTGGRRVDFIERDLGALPDLGGKGVSVPIAGHGITALRLTGVGLAGA